MTDGQDRLAPLRSELAQVDDLPLDQRAEVFEHVQRVLVDELNTLEEV